ncbi:MAG: class II aldolase/adducin family protein [Oscillospiraceae bacterium]|nr:class II aldolase/adducin family protein [Oscillospiraceae bacterium]
MRYDQEARQVIRTCLKLEECQYFLGTWGNVSLRVPNGILLTPSKVEYSTMQPWDLVVISPEGEVLEGHRRPTSEKEVHRRIMNLRPEVGAVIHAHTEAAMAVSTLEIREVPCLVEEMSQLLGGAIPLTRSYVPAEQHAALGQAAAEAIGDKNAVILRNHGPVCCGRTMEEALLTVQVVEKACALYLKAMSAGRISPIPGEYVRSERHRFLYSYGKENT